MQSTQTHPALQTLSALSTTAAGRLRRGQVLILAALSVLFWFMAALFIRYGVPAGSFGGVASAALFVLTVPTACLLIWTTRRVAALRPDQLVSGVALTSAVAMLCDGVALTWFPALYGGNPATHYLGAAWLLWGVGVILILAVIAADGENA